MENLPFNIGHPELKGFEAYYDKEVLPFLKENEGARLEAVKKAKIAMAILGVITLIIVVYFFTQDPDIRAFLLPIAGFAFGSFALFNFFTREVSANTKEKIVGAICAYVGWTFESKIETAPDLTIWRTLGLLPKGAGFLKSRRESFEDHIFGAAHGADFEAMEIHIEEYSDKKWRTLMRGQLMSITFPQKFLGTTVVLRESSFQPKTIANMKRVGLVDPVFERIFEAYGTDQVEARYLLTPTFMQRLVDLETSVSGEKIRFGFCEGRLLIVVETGNQFEAGSMLSSLMSTDRTQKILDEIAAVFHLVDGVMKPLNRRHQ